MKRYKVELKKSANKELSKLPKPTLKKVVLKLKALEQDPRPAGCKKLRSNEELWRVRVGYYRVVYTIDDGILIVGIRKIRHRKDIYKI